jgi:hypothetical protein
MSPQLRHAVASLQTLGIELKDGDYPGARRRLTVPQSLVTIARALSIVVERGVGSVIGGVLGG